MEISWIERRGRKILLIDYSGLKMERQMVEHVNSIIPILKDFKDGENLYLLSDLTGCYATPGFLEASRKVEKELTSKYNVKGSIVGISGPKAIILKGFNLISKVKLVPFHTRDEAIKYLCED